MSQLFRSVFVSFVLCLVALPALAQEHGGGGSEGSGVDVVPGLVWSSAGIAVAAVVQGREVLSSTRSMNASDQPLPFTRLVARQA